MKALFDYLVGPIIIGLVTAAISLAVINREQLTQKFFSTSETTRYAPVSYADAVDAAAPAVVNIYGSKVAKARRYPLSDDPMFRQFFNNASRSMQQRLQLALGSGVIVNSDGYILTNNHVVEAATELVVLLHDGREARAEVVGKDIATDIAVLKIDLDNLSPVLLGEPAKARIGDVVLAIGNPYGVGQTVTQGIISATGRYGLELSKYENYIQTDAAINPGNSGGALIDATGALLGINTAILDDKDPTAGISFAIPSDQAMQVLRSIIENGRVVRGWLGVETRALTPRAAQSIGLDAGNGVLVTDVYQLGPAHRAGIRRNDIITHIDGLPVGNGRNGMYQIAEKRPEETVTIEMLRFGEPISLTIQLAEKPVVSS